MCLIFWYLIIIYPHDILFSLLGVGVLLYGPPGTGE